MDTLEQTARAHAKATKRPYREVLHEMQLAAQWVAWFEEFRRIESVFARMDMIERIKGTVEAKRRKSKKLH